MSPTNYLVDSSAHHWHDESEKIFDRNSLSLRISIFVSLLLSGLFFAMGVTCLVSPLTARNVLYPCLLGMEKDENYITMVEGDMIRIAGGCVLSIALCSVVLLVSLLPCVRYVGTVQWPDSTDPLSGYYSLRLLYFLHVIMGLAFVGVGLFNLKTAEDNNSYNGIGKHSRGRCSSLKDQTILWIGVTVVCAASVGLMLTFYPESHTVAQPSTDSSNRCCFRKNHRNISPLEHHHDILDPLLINEQFISPEEPIFVGVETNGTHNPNNFDNVINAAQSAGNNDEVNGDDYAAEEKNTPSSSRIRGTTRLLKLAGRESFYLWIGIIVLLIRLPFSLSIPNFVSATIGDLIDSDWDGAKRNVLLLFLLGSVDAVLDFWCIFLFGQARENIVKRIRIDTFASILRQDQAFFDKSNTGDLISRLTSDCGEMAGDLTWFFRFSVEATVRIVGISTYMIIRCPSLGLCTVGIVPVVGVINKLYGDWLSKNALSVQNSLADATRTAHESLACMKTVITSASEDHEIDKYAKKINVLYSLNIRQLIASGIYFMTVSTFLINTCVQAALLWVGSLLIEEGKLTPEVLLAFMLYQGQLQEYTLNFFQSYSSLIKSSGAGDRVFYLLDRSPPPPGTGNQTVVSLSRRPSDASKTSGDIILSNVSFSYPTRPTSLALDNVSLEIKSGSLVALVGHSGCGKSTIVSLLERLYDPHQGTILFGNVDLKNMNLNIHRRSIGLVTQDPVLFSGSIKDNIGYGSSLSFEEIVQASKVANAHGFIESLPNKYDEEVGERGMNLSGGQKQRIAIARALIKKPALLLLDEATSALDPESEAAVQEALHELLRNRSGMTTIIIAHRLQTVRYAESIVVMKNGAVVEQGTHDQLVQRHHGHYRRMVDRSDSMGILPD